MMDDTINIRSMELEDIEKVHAIDRLSFSLPWPETSYRHELLENHASMCWVVEIVDNNGDSKIVGMAVVWLIIDEAHIATLAVHPEYRSMGIGAQLLKKALVEATKKGAREAMLEVRASNTVAQTMYRRFGFDVVFRRPRYYRDNNEDALLMSLHNLPDRVDDWKLEMYIDRQSRERGDA
jgi:[ribosomal protein S18]-alanine N-acetyltransferase